MSQRDFHKEHRRDTCGNCVDFFGSNAFHRSSTGACSDFYTAFVVEKASHRGFFLDFNNTTITTNG